MKMFSERDIDNLSAILDYCDRIELAYQRMGASYEVYLSDEVFRDALLMNILQIGEAANRLSDECREALHKLPWGSMIATRNIIVHGYTKVDDLIIWNIIENDIPALKSMIDEELRL